jgi:nitrite reductase/ring-hydroxylating ferredoxin subunit
MKTCWRLVILVLQNVFCYHPAMQSFDTEADDTAPSTAPRKTFVVGGIDDVRPGACLRIELPDGDELAVYNVNGEFYATENFCPHKGAPLSEGTVCGHIVECGWHGWQFDVRSGECLTVQERIKTYRVKVEEGLVKVEIVSAVS